jgi:hypothetical protein
VKANLCKVVQPFLELPTIKGCVVNHDPFPKQCCRLQITYSRNPVIQYKIPSLGASTCHPADAHGLRNRPDALCYYIIFPLCCQATIQLPTQECCGITLADFNRGVLSSDGDLQPAHLDSISICDNRIWHPEGIAVHSCFSIVVYDIVEDIRSLIL